MPPPPRPTDPTLGQAAAYYVKTSTGYERGSQLAGVEKKAAQARLAPVRSALLRQKSLAGQSLNPKLTQLKQAKSLAKSSVTGELGQAKKAVQPAKQLARGNLSALKSVAAQRKQAGLKAAAPSRSALLRQKSLTGQKLALKKATIGQDVSGIKKALQQSQAAKSAKKVGAVAKTTQQQTRKRAIARLLREN
jgi:hypothetical protein